jgi:hypothetical protein
VPLYDRIGQTYTNTRRPDPRIAAAIGRALALPRPGARVDLNGAATTCALLERLVAEGTGAWRSTASSASRSTRA